MTISGRGVHPVPTFRALCETGKSQLPLILCPDQNTDRDSHDSKKSIHDYIPHHRGFILVFNGIDFDFSVLRVVIFMAIKNLFKAILVITGGVIWIVLALLMLTSLLPRSDEDEYANYEQHKNMSKEQLELKLGTRGVTGKKDSLGYRAFTEIRNYFDKHGNYPNSLRDLPLHKNIYFASFVNKQSYGYKSTRGDKPNFYLSWKGGGMNWTWHHCTNDRSTFRETAYHLAHDIKPGETGCILVDLH